MSPAPEITASGDKEQDDNHGQDGRKAGADAGPMHVDKADSMIGLVDVRLFMRGLGVDGEVSVVSDDDGRGGGGTTRVAVLGNVFLDELLGSDVVDDALSITE